MDTQYKIQDTRYKLGFTPHINCDKADPIFLCSGNKHKLTSGSLNYCCSDKSAKNCNRSYIAGFTPHINCDKADPISPHREDKFRFISKFKDMNHICKSAKNCNRSYIAGFTLIEMLIVVAIIAILSGVVLAGVSNFQSRARDTRRIGDLRNVQSYLELYFNKCGHYPGVSDSNNSECSSAGLSKWSDLAAAMAKVTNKFPADPVPGSSYCYGTDSKGLNYAIQAVLENDNSILHGNDQGSIPTGVTITIGSCTGDKVYTVSS
jgi:prepilin-type N-terminal cleavage/methylation domain-containing protein